MKKKITIIIIAIILCCLAVSFAFEFTPAAKSLNGNPSSENNAPLETIGLQWNHTYEQKQYSNIAIQRGKGENAIQTGDGGYILACVSEAGFYLNSSAMLIKTDSKGKLEWQKNYLVQNTEPEFNFSENYGKYKEVKNPPIESSTANSVFQTPDGGYLMAGTETWRTCGDPIGNRWILLFLLKTDSKGDIMWHEVYGAMEIFSYITNGVDKREPAHIDAELSMTICTTDGGFVLGGTYNLQYGIWAVKTDASGKEQWNQKYQVKNEANYHFLLIDQTETGYNILASAENGYPNDTPLKTHDWLIRINKNGQVTQNVTCNNAYQFTYLALKGADGTYVWAGYNCAYDVDSQGNFKWNKTCTDFTGSVYSGLALSDGSYLFSSSNGVNRTFIKLDQLGNHLWTKICEIQGQLILENSDGSIISIGSFYDYYRIERNVYVDYTSWVTFSKTEPLPAPSLTPPITP